ncbi:CYTH and CHAD domain-containing protein [Microvirga thermotolerans]|uniref:CHAD domain-containing protein n=1 Tax=Microvirga thermotolerans TaxID=2651334 RepID=A0A5P9K081_9HYPH|nr:CYTH and CHAD domain-containing protein [Microvirga thermotolerans]QFU17408.1 CHAD domain-containing protein [Microvirga thermotolerans]
MHRANPVPPPREIELKLEWAAGSVADLLAHPLLLRAEPMPERSGILRATYYDTPDLALRRAGLSLRIREREGRFVQTLKAEGGEHGLALARDEWEWPLADGNLALGAASATPLAALLAGSDPAGSLAPVFTVETERQVFECAHGDALIEIGLDRSRIVAGPERAEFAEIELELRQGEVGPLFALALDLADAAALRLSLLTKSERGYRLRGVPEAEAEPARATPIVVLPDWSSADAFRAIARACLFQIVRNEEIVRRARSPEALHQMRVGTRRLKAAAAIFEDMLDDRDSAEAMEELRWIGRKLGRARDIDVHVETLRNAGSGLDRDALAKAEEEQARAYASLLRTFEKRRFRHAILRLAAWIEAGRWQGRKKAGPARALPAGERARKELGRRWKRIRRAARTLAEVGDGRRHRLRIRIKGLRYGIEFFSATFAGRKAERRRRVMLPVLQNLQDTLGELNDLVVAKRILAASGDREAARRRKRLLSRTEVLARRLEKAKPFWSRKAAEEKPRALNNAAGAPIRTP